MTEPQDHSDVVALADAEWRAYLEPLLPLGRGMIDLVSDPNNALARQEMYSLLFSAISMGFVSGFYSSVRHPEFWPQFNQHYSFASVNPDTIYASAPVEDSGVYKISGYRGTVRIINFQIGGGGFYPAGEGKFPPTYADYEIDSLSFDPEGRFEVILSGERPEGLDGDWWTLPPKSTYILLRQVAYDWANEIDGRLAIERLDTPAAKPPRNAKEVETALRLIPAYAGDWIRLVVERVVDAYRAQGLVNKVGVHDNSLIGGFITQRYIEGLFEINEDDALIYESDVPEVCQYWGIAINDMRWHALDFNHRQTSLNGFTARMDSDGKFRAVVSIADPGVPNWLDTAGHTKGFLSGRMKNSDSYPVPSVTKVKLCELRDHLPTDTPVVTFEEREAAIRARRRAAQLRRKW